MAILDKTGPDSENLEAENPEAVNPDSGTDAATQAQPDEAKKNKGGRPRADIDQAKLTALCQVHATDEEIAAHFQVSVKTIERLKKRPEYASCFEKGRADGRISLRRAQWQAAIAGNSTMLIWLGKQELGQRDQLSHEHSGPKGGPIQVHTVRDMLDAMSDEDLVALAAERGIEDESMNSRVRGQVEIAPPEVAA